MSRRRILALMFITALLLQSGVPILERASASALPTAGAPTALGLVIVPTRLPADNNSYPSVVVSLLDRSGTPTVAINNTVVFLSTSQQAVGQITAEVEIPVGQAYAVANFTTTKTPGTTTITATTNGLTSASVNLQTMTADGYPTRLMIAAIPSVVPANAVGGGSSSGNLLLELVDDVGLPAKAVSDTTITLYSSNTKIVNVSSSSVTMKAGQFIQLVNYTSGFIPGDVAITGSANEIQSGQATITVLGFPPLAVKLLAQPSQMVTCTQNVTSCNGRLVVALTDLNGNPTRALHDTVVQLRSSDLAVITSLGNVTIVAGSISAVADYTVTATAGTAEITASAPNLQSGFATVTTTPPNPVSPSFCPQVRSVTAGANSTTTSSTNSTSGSSSSNNSTSGSQTGCSLQIFAGPDPVLADDNSYSSVVVSLFSSGTNVPLGPAINSTGPTQVTLTSSVTGVGNFTKITFSIPEGQNWAAVTFTSTFQVGATQLTASGGNLLPVQSTLNTYGPVPSKIVLTPLSGILPADGQQHPALELSLENSLGAPAVAATDIPVSLISSQGAVVQVAAADIPAGNTVAIVNATTGLLQGSANVTAFESAFTSGTTTASTQLSTVIPPPSMLGVYASSQDVVSVPGAASPPIALQLQDSAGNPARARSDTNLTITSSNSTVIPDVLSATVQQGKDYGLLNVSASVPGSTTLTIFSSGLQVSRLALTFLPFPAKETLTGGPTTILVTQTAVVNVNVALAGSPLRGATVVWSTSSGGLIRATSTSSGANSTSTVTSTQSGTAQTAPESSLNDSTNSAGDSTMLFKPSRVGEVIVVAHVEQAGLPAKNMTMTITVTTPPHTVSAKSSRTLTQQLTSFPMVLAPIGGGAAGVAAIVVVLRRRGSGSAAEDDFGADMSS